MALKFSDLLATVALDEWKARIIAVANAVGLKTENWSEGGYTRTLVAVFSQLYKTAGDVVRIIAGSGFLDEAEGNWLEFLAKNLYGVDKIKATEAAAPNALVLTNGGGGLFTYDPLDIVVAHQDTGATYRNTTGGTLNPGIGQTLTLDLEAEEPGTDSNAGIGTITVMVTTSLGVTCTNVVALAGLDAESDPELRERCRDSVAALAIGGIKKAYEFFAKTATDEDGNSVGVSRVKVATAAGDGTLTVYIAGPGGALGGPEVAVVQGVFDEEVTPYGLDATAVSASDLSVTAPGTIWIPSSLGLDTATARQAVFAALEAYVEALPIGGVVITPTAGRVYWRALLAVIANAIPGTLKAQLTTETDVVVDEDEVPIWAGGLTDITVNQVG
jgi:uncharacterized phage protein gp47/JayE